MKRLVAALTALALLCFAPAPALAQMSFSNPSANGCSILGQSAVAASHTGDTSATTLATVTIPAGAMGANGRIEIKARYSFSGSASTRTVTVAFGGTNIYSSAAVAATVTNFDIQADVANRNATNSQFTGVLAVNSSSAVARNDGVLAIDTTAAQTVTFVGAVANAADTVKLESYQVLICPKS